MPLLRNVLAVFTVVLAFAAYVIHNQAPYLQLECVAFSRNCPIAKSFGTINGKTGTSVHLKPLMQIMRRWVKMGYSTGSQLSVFINNEERVNIFARDDRRYPEFDHNSLLTLWSTTQNFAALSIGMAIQNGWIASYHDAVADYWPDFPSQRLIISFAEYTKWFEAHCTKPIDPTQCNKAALRRYTDEHNVGNFQESFKPTIADILRHEGGYAVDLSNTPIVFQFTGYKEMKRMIESTPFLIHFQETTRCYHHLNRGYILNALFMHVEPKGRSMGRYFDDEIGPLINHESVLNEFFLRFDGKGQNHGGKRLYHTHGPPVFWSLYHVMLPIVIGWDQPLNGDLFRRQVCPFELVDAAQCPQPSLANTRHIIEVVEKLPMGTYKIAEDDAPIDLPIDLPKTTLRLLTTKPTASMRRWFEMELAMEHMSFAGVGTAHSVAKAASFMLFNGVLADAAVEAMTSEHVVKMDMLLGAANEFSAGGFPHWNIRGVDWYGWATGNSMAFAPKYRCTVALTVTASNSPHFSQFHLSRMQIVLDLVSQQLLEDAKNL